jgi:type II secretory pathway component PulK
VRYRRRGMILVLVLVVIALLALAAGSFSHLMVAERKAANAAGRQAQARASAESGVEMVRQFIVQTTDFQDQLGGWYDNERQFRGRMVVSNQQGPDVARFTIVAPRVDYGVVQGIRYGLEDESTRLNLNALIAIEKKAPGTGRQMLMGLPGMTDDIADSILDWMDQDEEPREFGAESEYYAGFGYAPKNGPLESIEELLLVRGIRDNPWLLFGSDTNRNVLPDVGEPDSQSIEGVDNSDGSMNRGWAAYLTLYSLESNLNPDGQPKIDLNQSDMQQLYDQLQEAVGQEWATFIVAYRLGDDAGDNEPVNAGTQVDLDFSQQPKRSLSSVLDLIGKNVKLTPTNNNAGNASGGGGQQGGNIPPTILKNPFSSDAGSMDSYLPTLMDYLTAGSPSPLAGRININQAPRAMLKVIPGMTDEIVDAIIGARDPNPTLAVPSRRHETWILSEGLVTLEQMKTLMPFITAGGSVYRAQVIGYSDLGGPAVRIETVLDATTTPAKIVFWRDISNLGQGYPLETLGVGANSGTTY